jgi:2-polyprenyl-3-methyl-5-hydroxy-6-metoxy-1,4-benzoquinol methylase
MSNNKKKGSPEHSRPEAGRREISHKDALRLEAEAFDSQIRERVGHGHFPDLRRLTPCEWFYNNTWRHPALVNLDAGEVFRRIRDALRQHLPPGRKRVLEIGCGPGHLSLELSREGFDVTGVDISSACIEVARNIAADDPWQSERGGLQYVVGDVFELAPEFAAPFDAVVFAGALHHFPDQEGILSLCEDLLAPGGLIAAHEPVRDRTTIGDAAVLCLLRLTLSQAGGWYRSLEVPADEEELLSEVNRVFAELSYTEENGSKAQSINDNEAGFADMNAALEARFEVLEVEPRHAIFHKLVGGLRLDEKRNAELARLFFDMDRLFIQLGVLEPSVFFFLARKSESSKKPQ